MIDLRRTIRALTDETWAIGFIHNSIDSILAGEQIQIDWVEHNYRDRWFADPFILYTSSKEIVLLVEEYYRPIERGRIARIVVDRQSMTIRHCELVLDIPTHLSFPAFFCKDNAIYMYPENSEAGVLTLYRYDADKNACEPIAVLLKEAVADAIITEIDGQEYLFCTRLPNPNGNVLSIYKKSANETFTLLIQ